jgi:hypothetical protein
VDRARAFAEVLQAELHVWCMGLERSDSALTLQPLRRGTRAGAPRMRSSRTAAVCQLRPQGHPSSPRCHDATASCSVWRTCPRDGRDSADPAGLRAPRVTGNRSGACHGSAGARGTAAPAIRFDLGCDRSDRFCTQTAVSQDLADRVAVEDAGKLLHLAATTRARQQVVAKGMAHHVHR